MTDETPRTEAGPPTICKCGLARSYHEERFSPDHDYEPRYEPEAWLDGWNAHKAEAAAAPPDSQREAPRQPSWKMSHTIIRPCLMPTACGESGFYCSNASREAAAAPPEPPRPDRFMENVAEARENGYDRLCAHCGVGVYDDSDMHDRGCPEYVEEPR